MPDHKLKHSSNWRRRREEYLRASGRSEDLISEGYESAGPAVRWVVIPGSRARRSPNVTSQIGLFVVKGATS